MPSPPLPPEILFKICKIITCDPSYYLTFPALHYPRTNTLKSCALVSRSWVAPARHYLFANDKPLFFFYVPFMERRFKEFRALCLSPYCTLHLARIDSLIAESKHDTLTSTGAFLEWFAGTSVTDAWCSSITSIRFRANYFSNYRFPEEALSGFRAFRSLAVLSLCAQSFASPSQVRLLLSSLPRLERLSCENVRVAAKDKEEEEEELEPSPVYVETLITDHPSFFSGLHPHITFPNLKKLFYRDTGVYRTTLDERLHQFTYIGRILELVGGQLEVLDLDCRARNLGIPDRDVQKHRSTISQIFDLSIKAPILKQLVLTLQLEMIIPALTFQHPHPALESVTLNAWIDDMIKARLGECDALLRRKTPLLRVFKVGVPKMEAGEFELDRDRDWDRPGSHVWQEIRRGEEEVEKVRMKMPWCAERGCIKPNLTFVDIGRRRGCHGWY